MAVRDGKKVCASILSKVGQNKERILILFVWVFRRVACFCCESKFCNAIVKLFISLTGLDRILLCGYFFRDWWTNVLLETLFWLWKFWSCSRTTFNCFCYNFILLFFIIELLWFLGWLFRWRYFFFKKLIFLLILVKIINLIVI
jgi:hypothetical protein